MSVIVFNLVEPFTGKGLVAEERFKKLSEIFERFGATTKATPVLMHSGVIKMLRLLILSLTLLLSVLAHQTTASSAEWRAELGLGAHGGDPEVSFAGETDDLDTNTGIAITAQLWADGVAETAPWLTLGLQYLRLDDADFSEAASGTVLGATVTAQLDLNPTLDGFLLNAAYRKPDGKFHPMIGGGIGIAKASVDAVGSVTVNGQTFAGTTDDDDTSLAWQMFAGFDYDVTDKAYIGVSMNYFGTDATLFSADVEFRNLVGMARAGYRF